MKRLPADYRSGRSRQRRPFEIGVPVSGSASGLLSFGGALLGANIRSAGRGAHASNESILLDRVADRVALLAGLVAEI